jgi:hypothetical protein
MLRLVSIEKARVDCLNAVGAKAAAVERVANAISDENFMVNRESFQWLRSDKQVNSLLVTFSKGSKTGALTSSCLTQQQGGDVLHSHAVLCRIESHTYVSTQIKTCFDRLG